MNKISSKNCQSGFTLIELMMAMVILGIGILAIVGLQTNSIVQNTASKKQTEGYNWAMDQIEVLKNLPYTHGDLSVSGDPINVVAGDSVHVAVQGPYTVEWDVADNGAAGLGNIENTRRVHVSVRWNGEEVAIVDFTRSQVSY